MIKFIILRMMRKKRKIKIPKILGIFKSKVSKIIAILFLLISLPIIFSLVSNQDENNTYARGALVIPPGMKPVYGVYASTLDGLAGGWETGILYGTITAISLTNKAPVFQGTNSISYTVTSPYDELKFEAPEPFDSNQFNFLTFYAQAGTPGMLFGVKLLNESGEPFDPAGNGVPMSSYGGVPPTGFWNVYNIPISAFNAPSTIIKGIVFKDLNGGNQNIQPPPPIYIDEINFSDDRGENIPLPSGSIQISGPTRVPTPIMPYYPDISPWVWIIPGIIVALAVIFQ